MTTSRALVIGYGSIGERHARVLENLGVAVDVVSRRGEAGGRPVFPTVAKALGQRHYDHGVIANETSQHGQSLTELAQVGFGGTVLVEKPLIAQPGHLPNTSGFRRARVGYNLRFHPIAQTLRAELGGERAEMADFYVGQWLPDWRPNRPLSSVYSGSLASGGGVLRDLSHELDLATWLFGPWIRVAATGGRLSNITEDADDGWGILLVCERCPVVTLHINGLDRRGRRSLTVQSNARTLHGDFVAGTFDGPSGAIAFQIDRDSTYSAMHRTLIVGEADGCSLEEGLEVVSLIEAIEKASRDQCWVTRR